MIIYLLFPGVVGVLHRGAPRSTFTRRSRATLNVTPSLQVAVWCTDLATSSPAV